ncbi:MAG: T9SS type A sorting domain-containing protein [Chitinophagaceae bacterium]
MKLLYPHPHFTSIFRSFLKTVLVIIFLIAACYSIANAQQSKELIFKNEVLESGLAGQDGAVYRFSNVTAGTDALVQINGRSSSMVQLVAIDLASTGFDKAFQPQVTYGDNTSPAGNTDWWMEFQVSFVQSLTNTAANVNKFNVTGLDIDGNNDKISEYVSFYGMQTYTLENNSALLVSTLQQLLAALLTNTGKRFDGPVTNYTNVDTSATAVMTTSTYANTSSFTMRTGAKSTGVSGAADRMYAFWFKSFAYEQGITSFLPVTLINWTAAYTNNNVSLKWSTSTEKNASHFIIERSFDGVEYSDAAMLFAVGNSNIVSNYSFTDKVPAGSSGIIYYRLKMQDIDGRYKTSDVRIVRIGKSTEGAKILAYPNPVVNDIKVTIPQSWQGKQVGYQLTNANGQVVKSYNVQYASQTEVINMSQVPTGMYVMRVISGTETAVQSVFKSNK